MASDKMGKAKRLRQKVVNLMYLVFIVLAFIYVPSDFIDTIKDVNVSLEQANRDIKNMNYFHVKLIKAMWEADSTKKLVNYAAYPQVMSLTDSVDRAIENLKLQLQRDAGGLNRAGYIVNGKENFHSDEIFIAARGAEQLKELLTMYKRRISELTGITSVITPFDSIIITDPYVYTSTGKAKEWERFYFYKVPGTVTITLLSKFQSDIRQIEYMLIAPYLQELTSEYDVVLSRKDEEKKRRLMKEEPSRPIMDPRANIQSDDYIILYTDIDNPLRVHHPNYSNTQLTARINDGEIFLKDSTFYARVSKTGMTEVSIYHPLDNVNPLVRQNFLVKSMPEPSAFLADRTGGVISSKIFKLQSEIRVKSIMSRFDVEYLVKHFSVMRVTGNASQIRKSDSNPGGNFNVVTRQIFDEAKRGDIYIFNDIEAKTPAGSIINIKAMVFTII